ncbi:uncharacterized protein FIBRA_05319 [Fibroporia radiculosa]|uniref:G-protein alpha subunit n=1 Tax=Fibroporia radiculosa TaxID=599839 RepID=J4GQS2_9APHY|nr:uncharacterized protein FIBRA_05319 [Fibroporia radiculosa]CCM03195.1 predicted protein [Fibroporia radiculosa]
MSAVAHQPLPEPDPSPMTIPLRLPTASRRSIGDVEAARISTQIDEELRREHESRKRRRPREIKGARPSSARRPVVQALLPPSPLRLMLLGQAESGKSTLQKQFQLYYASQTLDHERPSWRPIVYFNVLKAIRMILTEVDFGYFTNEGTTAPTLTASSEASSSASASFAYSRPQTVPGYGGSLDPVWLIELTHLRSKLLPLVASEDALASELSGGVTVTGGRSGVYVRAGWQAVSTATRSWPFADIRSGGASSKAPVMTDIVAKTLAANQDEIVDLWHHPAVRRLLAENKLQLEEYAAFFLNSIHRIAQPDYLPTTEDILHVRLQTLGVQEHAFDISMAGVTYNWLLYDVGGAYLEEDMRTNRIDDSLQLFTVVCQNKLLHKAALVLMLNKVRSLITDECKAGLLTPFPSPIPPSDRLVVSTSRHRACVLSTLLLPWSRGRTGNVDGSPEAKDPGWAPGPQIHLIVRRSTEYVRGSLGVLPRALHPGASAEGPPPPTVVCAFYVHAGASSVLPRPIFSVLLTGLQDVKATQSIIVNVNEAIMRKHMSTIGLA